MPQGRFFGQFDGRRYVVSRTPVANARGWKLVGEELGGRDYISLNLYRTPSGALLRPCEMAPEKVVRFVLGLRPETGN